MNLICYDCIKRDHCSRANGNFYMCISYTKDWNNSMCYQSYNAYESLPKDTSWKPYALGIEFRFHQGIRVYRSKMLKNYYRYGLDPEDCTHTKKMIYRIIKDYLYLKEIRHEI